MIRAGIELNEEEKGPDESQKNKSVARQRRKGGGRKSITEADFGIVQALLDLVDKESYVNPEKPLRRTCMIWNNRMNCWVNRWEKGIAYTLLNVK